ncbi:hypothetical protein QYE76_055889 [Lolium multiflorum]|uniref:CCHC-type domain-containing protein n=1 Tax=Lolium multiflorum TaxID=4521 RepID=A0AAD8T1F2_LOLMU|nr:hypothetical protein QYE76_055889 [Lolium multiflorum]
MIHMAVTPKDRAHIRSLKTAKEAWDKLDKLFLGNESIQSSRFDEVNNMAYKFVMIEGESPEEMYRHLIALAVQMQDLGETFNAEDLVARAHNTRKPNLALKMREHDASENDEDPMEWSPDDLKTNYHEHMALAAKNFWDGKNTRGSRPRGSSRYSPRDSPRSFSKSPREGQKGITCYNCGGKSHFIADCIYERREENGGRLVRKDKFKSLSKGFSKFSSKPGDAKVFFTKNPGAFIIREEYSSKEGEEREDKRLNKEDEGVADVYARFYSSYSGGITHTWMGETWLVDGEASVVMMAMISSNSPSGGVPSGDFGSRDGVSRCGGVTEGFGDFDFSPCVFRSKAISSPKEGIGGRPRATRWARPPGRAA